MFKVIGPQMVDITLPDSITCTDLLIKYWPKANMHLVISHLRKDKELKATLKIYLTDPMTW